MGEGGACGLAVYITVESSRNKRSRWKDRKRIEGEGGGG